MTPEDIRARYVLAIGLTATTKLAAAGLLPVAVEEQWPLATDTTSGDKRLVEYRRQTRLVTAWSPEVPAP